MKLSNFWNEKIRWQAPGDPASGGTQTAPEPVVTEPAAPAGPDLSFIPAEFVKDGAHDLAGFTAHYQSLVASEARRGQDLPADGAYDFTVPADLKFDGMTLPEGFALDLDLQNEANKPLVDELSSVLKELGAPAAASGKLTSILAKYEASRHAQAFAAQQAEMAQLGTPAQSAARMATVTRALETTLPADLAKALIGDVMSAKSLMALEKLLSPRTLSAPPAAPAGPDLEKMSAYDRLKHANATKPK